MVRRRTALLRSLALLDGATDPGAKRSMAVLFACLPAPYGRGWSCDATGAALQMPVIEVRAGLVTAMSERPCRPVTCPEILDCEGLGP